MATVYSPIRYSDLLKSCMIFFMIQAFVVFVFFQDLWHSPIVYRVAVLGINVALSIIFGWRLYKQRYHRVFAYDNEGFTLKRGKKEEISHRWSEFSEVSLVRTEQGDFSIRLHGKEPFDLPISKLKLNPFDFRSKAAKFVKASQKKNS